jgi:hypothetical protein
MPRKPKVPLSFFLERAREMKRRASLPTDIDDYLVGLAITTAGYGRFKKEITKTLIHRYARDDYEVFEFLGDAIIHNMIRTRVFELYGQEGPKLMTLISGRVEKNSFFLNLMISRDLCGLIFTNSSELGLGRKHPLCADVFEALVGIISYHFNYVKGNPEQGNAYLKWWLFQFWQIDKYIRQASVGIPIVEVPPDVIFTCMLKYDKTLFLNYLQTEKYLQYHLASENELIVIYQNETTSVELVTFPTDKLGNNIKSERLLHDKIYVRLKELKIIP